MSKVFKYLCPTHRNEVNGEFRTKCDLCSCSHFAIEPGVKKVDSEQELFCPHTNQKLELIDQWEVDIKPTFIGFKMSETEIRKDRMKRSKEDFKKNVFKTLPKEDKRIFLRKDTSLKNNLD